MKYFHEPSAYVRLHGLAYFGVHLLCYDGLHIHITECRCLSIHHLTIESPEKHLSALMVRSRGLQLLTSVHFVLSVCGNSQNNMLSVFRTAANGRWYTSFTWRVWEWVEVKKDLSSWRPIAEAAGSADCYEYLMTDFSILLKLRAWEYIWVKWVGRASSSLESFSRLTGFNSRVSVSNGL